MSRPTSTASMSADPRAVAGLEGWPPPALDPAGPFAEPVSVLSWVLLAMGGAVLLTVLLALGLALFGPRRWRRRLGGPWLVWIGGLAFPVVVLSALLIYGLSLTGVLSQAPAPGEMRVRVTGEMWWWRVAYLNADGREVMQDANEVHIPVGRPVVFELDAADVIHSFWVPRLGGKRDMIPGRRNVLRLQADAPGVYAGQCAEYCGGPHALMGFVVVAHTPEAFEAWRAQRAAPARAPVGPLAMRGAEVFASAGCGACHSSRLGRKRPGRSRPHPCRIASHSGRRHFAEQPRDPGWLDLRQPGNQARQSHAGLPGP